MRQLLMLTLLLLSAAGCTPTSSDGGSKTPSDTYGSHDDHACPAHGEDGIFIHLSSGPELPHRVGMALKMAEVMATDKNVAMYLDIEAVKLVVKEAPDVEHDGFTGSLEQIGKLLEMGVLIQACPTCLKVAGYTGQDLRDGVVLADKDKFFTFTSGRILTIDY